MTQYGVDYSVSRPSLSALKAAGKTFVVRYLAKLPNAKVLTKAELAALHAAGFGVVFNWEQAAGDMGKGRTTGRAHATEALKQMNALGVGTAIPVYFSCDFDVTTTAQLSAVKEYLRGCAEVLGVKRVGVYGQYAVINACLPTYATWGWQTYAWSGGKVSSEAHLYQYNNNESIGGGSVDLDRSLKDNFGALFPAKPTKGYAMTIALEGYSLPKLVQGDDDNRMAGYNYVTRAQLMLNSILHSGLTTDGVYGPATAAAVKQLVSTGNGTAIGLPEWAQLYGLSKSVV